MKRFLNRRWRSVPIGILAVIMALVVIAGSAFAAYNFTSMSVNVAVDEPLQAQYQLSYVVHDNESPNGRTVVTPWADADPTVAIDAFFSAGDEMTLYLRMNNRAISPLTVTTVIGGNTGQFDYDITLFPNGSIPASTGYDFGSTTVNDATAAEWTSGGIPLAIKGDAPPGNYSLTFTFSRE